MPTANFQYSMYLCLSSNAAVVFIYLIIFLFYVYEGNACMDVGALMLCNAHGSQKRMSDSLGLEIQTVVSHYVGAGNTTQVFCESRQCS